MTLAAGSPGLFRSGPRGNSASLPADVSVIRAVIGGPAGYPAFGSQADIQVYEYAPYAAASEFLNFTGIIR